MWTVTALVAALLAAELDAALDTELDAALLLTPAELELALLVLAVSPPALPPPPQATSATLSSKLAANADNLFMTCLHMNPLAHVSRKLPVTITSRVRTDLIEIAVSCPAVSDLAKFGRPIAAIGEKRSV